ncbi:DEHA2A08272p [Debaryomyces hansenii CBS767]|uniref:DEHA2A08272p n=1 Tax=Debaryomyces hansenii (strain ATCC 36239 / CBS 767 / BCRC 21394 / JCM 1990 / NBRC 0083 / IGC 2968) TaxID=284592 RepID=B5RSS9_DEBHA|nr:DEHA2A08272p [Debaryomyces hansenii CBS767]CAR65385.1 DEHA2A08272p [Debaryomyces hansenii CBS767]|eukprot:XP_002770008.1 DEHA2A08272p [Debaryomyces hansenii CBS767]
MKAKKTNKLTGMKAPEVDNMTNNINEAKKGKIIDAVDTTNFPIQTDTNLSPFFKAVLGSPGELSPMQLGEIEDIPSSVMSYNETNDIDFSEFSNILLSPSSTFSLYLDEPGLRLLEYFENKVAKILCISPESSNYFLKTFVSVAMTEESIMHALAAWGGVFSEGASSELVNYHMSQATILIHERHLANSKLNKHGYYVAVCYYLIAIGIEICSGDVSKWYKHFNACTELLRSYGGLAKFLKDFNYSNNVKWLIASFQFHDIMSSVTLSSGTSCSMKNYNNLFKNYNLLDIGDYGIDPYQGCIQPIYLILGEIMNSYVELKEERKKLKASILHLSLEDSNSSEIDGLMQQRIEHYNIVSTRYDELLNKVQLARPNEKQIASIMNNKEELDLHLTLFELYRLTCQMYLLLYIKQTQPSSSEVQMLLLTSFAYISTLVESPMTASLSMSLLICGISCCNHSDRNYIRTKFTKIYDKYKAGNVRRVWDIVEESWRRNPDGNICIDWVEICEQYGWKLPVC